MPYAFWDALSEAQLAVLDFFRGNWASALEHAQGADGAEAGSSLEGYGAGLLIRQLAYTGERVNALTILDERRTRLPVGGQPNTRGSWLMLASVVEGLVVLGELGRAAQLYPLVRELVDTGAVTLFPIFRFTHTIAGIGAAAARQWGAAEDHFEAALHQAESLPYLLEQAEIRRFHAMMLIERGRLADRKRTRRMLTMALETYASIGMPLHCDLTQGLVDRLH